MRPHLQGRCHTQRIRTTTSQGVQGCRPFRMNKGEMRGIQGRERFQRIRGEEGPKVIEDSGVEGQGHGEGIVILREGQAHERRELCGSSYYTEAALITLLKAG